MPKFGKDQKIVEADALRTIPTFSVKFSDVFNLKNLYVMMHELLLEEGWVGWEGNDEGMASHSDMEILYSENVYQKGIHKGGKEYWVWWRLQKPWEKGSDYFHFALDIDWHIVKSNPLEIVHQGKKLKTQSGELEIFFKARVMGDLGLQWQKHKFLKHFKKFYEERITHGLIEKREKELWRDVYRISNKVKAYLKLRTWQPEQPAFHAPIAGWEAQF